MARNDNRTNWLIAAALTGWLLYLLAPVLTPFVAAGLLAYMGDPLADRLQRLRFPRTIAVVTVFLLTFLLLGLLILLVVPLIQTQVSALLQALPGIIAQAEGTWLPWARDFLGIDPGSDIGLAAFLSRYSEMAGSWGAKVLLSLGKGGGALVAALLSLFLIPILTFYLLRDWDSIMKRLGALVPSAQRETVFKLARDTDDALGAFLRGQILVMFESQAGSWGAKVLLSLGKGGGALVAALLSLFLIPILTFYLLRDWDSIMKRLGALVPSAQRETVFKLARDTDDALGAFLRGQILVMFALSIIYSTGLTLVGLEFAIAIGVVAGLVSFVPYLGFVFGIGLAGLTVAMEPNPLWMLAGVVATFTIAQMIEGSFLTPKLVGDRIGLHPVIVIFSIVAGGQLFGFFGVLLALPAAAILSVLVRFAYNQYLAEHPETAVEENPGEPTP